MSLVLHGSQLYKNTVLDNKRSFKEFKRRKWSEYIFGLGRLSGNCEEPDWGHSAGVGEGWKRRMGDRDIS